MAHLNRARSRDSSPPERGIHGRVLLWATAILVLAAGPVHGHAIVVRSTPADAAVLAASPPEVRLRFNAHLEPSMSRVTLVDVNGNEIPLEIEPPAKPGEVSARVPALEPGVYRVVYRVLARDGHVTEGETHFTVQRP